MVYISFGFYLYHQLSKDLILQNKIVKGDRMGLLRSVLFTKQKWSHSLLIQVGLLIGGISRGVVFIIDPWGNYNVFTGPLHSIVFRLLQVIFIIVSLQLPLKWRNVLPGNNAKDPKRILYYTIFICFFFGTATVGMDLAQLNSICNYFLALFCVILIIASTSYF